MASVETDLAPYAILRVASVPLDRVQRLRATRSAELVAEAIALEARIETLRPALKADLHAIVPAIREPAERAATIRLRRDVHNARRPKACDRHLSRIRERLEGAARGRLDNWLAARATLDRLVDRGEAVLKAELSECRPMLWSLIDEPFFYRGLAAANERFLEDVLRWRTRELGGRTLKRVERGLASYLLRAACKTSPFGAFLQIAAISVDPDDATLLPSLNAAKIHSRFYINRGIVARLLDLVMQPRDEAHRMELRRNPTLKIYDDGTVTGLVWRQISLLQRPWRQEHATRFTFHPKLAALLRELPPALSSRELMTRFTGTGLTRESALSFTAKLLERGLVTAPAVIDAYIESPMNALTDFLQSEPTARAEIAIRALSSMSEALVQARRASSTAHYDVNRAIRVAEADALAALGASSRDTYRPAYSEINYLTGAEGSLGAETCQLLSELDEFLQQQIKLRPDYLYLEREFRLRYGEQGVCRDVVGFLSGLSRRTVHPVEAEGEVRAPPPASRLTVTAFVQLSAGSAGARKDTRLVVNRVYEGFGWLAARFATDRSEQAAWLRERLAGWLQRCASPAEPLDVPLSGNCNDLQAHPILTERILAWPGEPIKPGRAVVEAHDLTVKFGPSSGLLQIADAAGKLVMPVYLGSVLPVPSWGSSYWLTVLANPLRVRRPAFVSGLPSSATVEFHPRRTFKRVVLRRAFWVVRSRVLTHEVLDGTGFARLVALRRFCRAHGIPAVLFARAQWHSDPIGSGTRTNDAKPVFIDIANHWCVELLARVARRSKTTILTEALPVDEGTLCGVDGDRHVTELLVELAVALDSG